MLYGEGNHRYELIKDWLRCPDGYGLEDIHGLWIDGQDRVYIFHQGSPPIMIFSPEGELISTLGEGLFKGAHHGFVGGDGAIYVADYENHTVTKLSGEGKVLLVLGMKDRPSDTGYVRRPQTFQALSGLKREGGPPFNRPTGVAVSSAGEIYVSDGYGNARVHKFNPEGRLLFSWGRPGDEPGEFRLPHSICIDRQGRLWVADRENNRIQAFNARGEFLEQWFPFGRPTDVCTDKDGNVYVAELSRQISILDPGGKRLARWGSQGETRESALFLAPHTVAVDSQGSLYVGEVPYAFEGLHRGNPALRKFIRVK